MEILYIMIPISILLGSVFLAAFILASKDEQFEDMETPALRMLLEDENNFQNKKEDLAMKVNEDTQL